MIKIIVALVSLFACFLNAETITGLKISGHPDRVIPYYICEFQGSQGKIVSDVVNRDLQLYGTFAKAKISVATARKLDANDYQKKTVDFSSWKNVGVQVLGKGSVLGTTTLTIDFKLYMPYNGIQVLAKRYTASAKSARRVGHQIADDIIKAVLKEKGFFSSLMLYVKTQGKNKSINICEADGGNSKALTSGKAISTFPAWYPNGKSCLFTSFHEGRPIIYKMNFSDGKFQRLLAMPGMNTSGTVSADGRKLSAILDKDGRPELYVFNIKSGSRVRLTTGRAAESSPSFSPDGRQIVFASDKSGTPQIYIIPATGGTPRSITSRTFSRYCTSPTWSPDGKKIAFVAKLNNNYEICIYDFASKQIYQLTKNPSNDEHPDWARNSRHLAFCRNGSRIILIDSETGNESTLINSSYKCSSPAWQP